MRRVVKSLILSVILTASCGPLWAHGAEELGHHWHVAAYNLEMRTQVLAMAAIAAGVFVVMWLKQTGRIGRARQ